MSPAAKAKWDQLLADLSDREEWSDRDRHALYVLADSLASYEQASLAIMREGQVIEGKQGGLQRNPNAIVQAQAWDRIQKLLHWFGLTPAGRKAIGASDNKAPTMADLLAP